MKRLLLFLAFAASCFAAGSVQQTTTQLGNSDTWVLTYRWTGDSVNGSVPVTPGKDLASCCQGYVVTAVQVVPGTPNPTALYSVALPDGSGIDVLGGAATSLSATVASSFTPSGATVPLQGAVSLTITGQNAPGAKGVVLIYFVKPSAFTIAQPTGPQTVNWITQVSNKPFIDVRYYGAKCDGIADDTTAINEAIAQAPRDATVSIPPGLICRANIVINRSSIALTSVGPLYAATAQITPATPGLDVIQIGDGVTAQNGISVSNLVIAGPPSPTGSGIGINVRRVGVFSARNIRIFGNSTLWRGISFFECISCEVLDSQLESTVDRMISESGSAGRHSTDIWVMRNKIDSFGADGIWAGDYADGLFNDENEIFSSSATIGWALNMGDRTVDGCCVFFRHNEVETTAGDMGWVNAKHVTGGRLVLMNNTFSTATPSATSKIGIQVDATVDDIVIEGGRMQCGADSWPCIFTNAPSTITGITFDGLGSTNTLVRLFAGAGHIFSGNKIVNSSAGINASAGASKVNISGNTFVNVPDPVGANSDPTSFVLGSNTGIDDQVPTVASGATITAPVNPTFIVSGSSAITTMNGFWTGRKVTIQFSDASPGGVTASGGGSGAFAVTKSVAANGALYCTYLSSWVCVN